MPQQTSSQLEGVNSITHCYPYESAPAIAVKHLKYDRITSLSVPMAMSIREAYDAFGLGNCDVVVPVPIHWRRRASRGFNQADRLASKLPRQIVRTEWLRRTRFTKPQVQLAPEERLTNLHDAFRAFHDFATLRVLLLDDVVTSGGTAVACASALKAAGAKSVDLLVYARTRVEARPQPESQSSQ